MFELDVLKSFEYIYCQYDIDGELVNMIVGNKCI